MSTPREVAAKASAKASVDIDPDEVISGFQSITLGLLHGPIVQFAQPAPGQSQASIVAMPPQLPLSVDSVFVFPPTASLPDSIAHFCFAPVLKLHEPSELAFTLTDSKGDELHGVSVQVLVPHQSSTKGSAPKHRPVALCMLAGRPIFDVLSKLLHRLLPLVQHGKVPTTKRTKELKVRVSRNQYGLGLVMGQNNVVMSVEAGSMAAKERQLRPGDMITTLDGEALVGIKFSDALQKQTAGGASAPRQHHVVVTRTYEVITDGSAHHMAFLHACRSCFGLLRKREQDLRWLVCNPFWLPTPLEPLFSAMGYNVPEIAYLIAACLTDQKVPHLLATPPCHTCCPATPLSRPVIPAPITTHPLGNDPNALVEGLTSHRKVEEDHVGNLSPRERPSHEPSCRAASPMGTGAAPPTSAAPLTSAAPPHQRRRASPRARALVCTSARCCARHARPCAPTLSRTRAHALTRSRLAACALAHRALVCPRPWLPRCSSSRPIPRCCCRRPTPCARCCSRSPSRRRTSRTCLRRCCPPPTHTRSSLSRQRPTSSARMRCCRRPSPPMAPLSPERSSSPTLIATSCAHASLRSRPSSPQPSARSRLPARPSAP